MTEHTPHKPVAARLRECLAEICSAIGWPVGHAYLITEIERALMPTDVWHRADPQRFDALMRATRLTALRSVTAPSLGTGLPRRVVATARPVWVPDITRDARFLRARLAAGLGVRAAFGVPVLLDGEVRYVLEFFNERALDADPRVLQLAQEAAARLAAALARQAARPRRDER